jgi:hypothetical protein
MNRISFDIGSTFLGSSTHFLYQLTGVGTLISLIINASFVIAGIIILFMFILGGISLIAGAGSGDSKRTGQGKQAVTYAVIGFIVVFTAYWIVKLIESLTGTSFIF